MKSLQNASKLGWLGWPGWLRWLSWARARPKARDKPEAEAEAEAEEEAEAEAEEEAEAEGEAEAEAEAIPCSAGCFFLFYSQVRTSYSQAHVRGKSLLRILARATSELMCTFALALRARCVPSHSH